MASCADQGESVAIQCYTHRVVGKGDGGGGKPGPFVSIALWYHSSLIEIHLDAEALEGFKNLRPRFGASPGVQLQLRTDPVMLSSPQGYMWLSCFWS